MKRAALIALYLAAIVAANLLVNEWQQAAIYNAFLLIGLDLIVRDKLHDAWRGRALAAGMAGLIFAGSAISYVLGAEAVAVASAVAFGAAFTADALVYQALRRWQWLERANLSNVAGAAVDSFVFVALWPYGFTFTLAFTLFAAKVAGGLLWSLVLDGRRVAAARV